MEKIKIEYQPDDRIVETEKGLSILQISLKNQIPHTHICFGEAQCSTCRVEILEGLENLPPRNELEEHLAKKKGWTESIRLACQTIPEGDIKIRRLVLDNYDAQIAQEESSSFIQGTLDDIVVLFVDIKDFTKFVEKELPYDVVFLLNRYFNTIGDIVLINDGYIDKFIGDSLMAIFGINTKKPTIEFCLDGVFSAIKISEKTYEFNQYLKKNFNHELFIRIGLAYGKAVLGMFGHRKKNHYTAIGDVVNLASRLENANKKTNTTILISDSLYQFLKNKLVIEKKFRLKLKGFSNIQIAYEVLDIIPEEKIKREKKVEDFFKSSVQLTKEEVSVEPNKSDLNLTALTNLVPLEVDKQHSQILFKVSHLYIEVLGIARDFEAELYYDPNNFLNSRIKIVIPVRQITTFVDSRDQHLYSADFFDSEKFPNIIFVSTEIVQNDKNEYILYGNLFIRGITKKIQIFLFKKSEIVDPYGNLKLCFSGNTTINREDFEMYFNITLKNGEFLIGKEVKILFEFECIKK